MIDGERKPYCETALCHFATGSALIGISFRQMRRNLSSSPRCSSRVLRVAARDRSCVGRTVAARDISRRLSLDRVPRAIVQPRLVVTQQYFSSSSVLQNKRARTHERSSSSALRSCRSCRSIVFFRYGAEMSPGTAK